MPSCKCDAAIKGMVFERLSTSVDAGVIIGIERIFLEIRNVETTKEDRKVFSKLSDTNLLIIQTAFEDVGT